jgi:hypothetical protein
MIVPDGLKPASVKGFLRVQGLGGRQGESARSPGGGAGERAAAQKDKCDLMQVDTGI